MIDLIPISGLLRKGYELRLLRTTECWVCWVGKWEWVGMGDRCEFIIHWWLFGYMGEWVSLTYLCERKNEWMDESISGCVPSYLAEEGRVKKSLDWIYHLMNTRYIIVNS